MAKIGEFYIATVKPAWEKDRYAVREKIGIGPGEWRRVGSSQSHYQAVRIMEALTDKAKHDDPLHGIDVGQEMEDILKERVASEAWTHVLKAMAEGLSLPLDGELKSYGVTIRAPSGATITTHGQSGNHICTHKGGDERLTITIE